VRYFVGFLITIGLIVLILFLLLSGGKPSAPKVAPLNLETYAYTSSTAQLIIDGPIVSDQDHREVQIDVSATEVTINIYQGYEQNLLQTKTYPNNDRSYAVFLHALQLNGFQLGDNSKAFSDERGHCATGERNIYSFNDGSKDLFRYWSTTCSSGTFKGMVGPNVYLFQKQVPDYAKLTAGTSI